MTEGSQASTGDDFDPDALMQAGLDWTFDEEA